MGVRTVFFDFGGTLAEQIVDPLDIWTEVVNELSIWRKREQLGRALERANDWFQGAVFAYHGRTAELWREYDRIVLRQLKIRDPDGRQVASIQKRFDQVRWHRCYPESRWTLEEIQTLGYELGVISNATEEVQDRLRELDLARYFGSITYSQEVGVNKPDPRIFLVALKRGGCAPDEAIHVGNTYEEDVLGARSVGATPVLVDRHNERPDADCPRVRDLQGVIDFLGRSPVAKRL